MKIVVYKTIIAICFLIMCYWIYEAYVENRTVEIKCSVHEVPAFVPPRQPKETNHV